MDLNPIDHLLGLLKCKIRAQSLQINLRELTRVIHQICAAIPQQYNHRHSLSMSTWYLFVDATPGGSTSIETKLNTTWFDFAVFLCWFGLMKLTKCVYCYLDVHCCYRENTIFVNMITYLSGIKIKFIKWFWYSKRCSSVKSLEWLSNLLLKVFPVMDIFCSTPTFYIFKFND